MFDRLWQRSRPSRSQPDRRPFGRLPVPPTTLRCPMSLPTASNRQIYLVQPTFPPSYWGLDYLVPLNPFNAIFPPLGLLTLAALSPPEYEVTICDENAGERVSYDTDAAIVG